MYENTVNSSTIIEFDADNLNDDEADADDFFREQVDWIDEAELSDGKIEDNKYTFQYISDDVPITITQANAEKWDDGSFHILQILKNVEVPVEGGRLAKSTNLKKYDEWDDAMSALDWNWFMIIIARSITINITPV